MEYHIEKEQKIPVEYRADVIVAGGGVAGVAAAISASRDGAKVLLIERYGQLGGQATGGLVTVHLGYGRLEFGLNKEIGEAILARGAGSIETMDNWDWVDDMGFTSKKRILYDGEDMKFLLERMLVEENVEILYHSYIVGTVIEENVVKGVIIESKAGRSVAEGKIVVDATGDGDVFVHAGAEYETEEHPWGITLGHRFGGVDMMKALHFQIENKVEYEALIDKLETIIGVRYRWRPSAREGITLCMGPRLNNYDVLDPRDSTRLEIKGKEIAMKTLDFLKENVPGFEKAFIVEFAPQFGIRTTRRVVGEYILSTEEVKSGARFDDAIIRSIYDVPYGVLLPKKIDNLLVAGRCISMTPGVDELRLIGPCIATGEAAGTAAALAFNKNVKPRDIDIKELQSALKNRTFP
jgi:hypothetical protein